MDLRLPGLNGLLRRPRRLLAAGAAVVVLAGAGTWTAVANDETPPVHREDRALPTGDGIRIDTSFFTTGGDRRRPAVLLGHGFGGSKKDVRQQAEDLARDGYAVLTWSARGFGTSNGKIGLNDPKGEVADVSKLIDWLAKQPQVELDKKGDPRVGMAGGSYGGAIALLTAGHDPRVDAIAPAITYWNLADALFPNGVFKKLWAGIFVNSGGGCEKFEPALCRMYERVAESGKPDAEARKLLEERSPSAVGKNIKVPTLLMQGQSDSLFPLGQADRAAKAIRANGAPVDVDWIAGGHDGGDMETGRVEGRVTSWFDRYLKDDKGADTGPAFRVTRTLGQGSGDGEPRLTGVTSGRYPGLEAKQRSIALAGREQSFDNPPGAAARGRPDHRLAHRHRPREVHRRRRGALRQALRRRPGRRHPAGAALPTRHAPQGRGRQGRQGRHHHPPGDRPRGRRRPPAAPGPRLDGPRLRLPGLPGDVHRLPQGRSVGPVRPRRA